MKLREGSDRTMRVVIAGVGTACGVTRYMTGQFFTITGWVCPHTTPKKRKKEKNLKGLSCYKEICALPPVLAVQLKVTSLDLTACKKVRRSPHDMAV